MSFCVKFGGLVDNGPTFVQKNQVYTFESYRVKRDLSVFADLEH